MANGLTELPVDDNDLRVSMPEGIMARMAAVDTPEAGRAEGIKIAQEMLAEVRGQVQGVQVSAPFGKYTAAAQVLGFTDGGEPPVRV